MTAEEMTALLKTTGLPVAYGCFRKKVALPYLVWLESGTRNFYADGGVYLPVRRVQVELYTQKHDPDTERRVEAALRPFCWEKTEETWLEDEECFESLYEFEV